MNLVEALQRPEFVGLTDQQALDHGNTTTAIPDSTRWSYVGVADRFGVQAAEGIHAAILGAGMNAAAAAYVSPGIDLSLDVTQAQLTAIKTAVPSLGAVCDSLKAIGRPSFTLWQQWGVDQPTLNDITTARAEIANENAIQAFSTLCQTVIAQWRSGAITNLAGAKSAIAGG